MVCPQKRPMIIKASVFLLATLIILSMPTVIIAQSRGGAKAPLTTLEEEKLLKGAPSFEHALPVLDPTYVKALENYIRDGCKKVLCGDWLWPFTNDIITITYNKKYDYFVGTVTRPVQMDLNPGHILFIVNFPENRKLEIPRKFDLNWLQQQKKCENWRFEGIESSFEEKTRTRTQTPLAIILDHDQLEYKVAKDAFILKRKR
jgi:hypothetical protein